MFRILRAFFIFWCQKIPQPIFLRLAENKRKQSLNAAKNFSIETTYKLGVLSFKKAA